MTSSGHHRTVRGPFSATSRVLASVLLAVVALAASTLIATPAYADPAPPPDASEAVKRLAEAQREAEVLTEQWHAAKDRLDVKQAAADRAEADVLPAMRAAQAAERQEEAIRVQMDKVASQALATGRLDQLNALFLSDSPSDFLDQMSTLESFTADQKLVLDQALNSVRRTRQMQADADATARRAQRAADEARAAAEQIGERRQAAQARITEVEQLLDELSPADQESRTEEVAAPVGEVIGTSKGALALKAAMTRMQSPYVWGAEGPATFDCSGLMYWAFKKVGITLPRSSSAQSQVGRPVSRSELRPGDMVFFYSPVSHVGFYAGDGKVLNAVQTGDVVRYSDLDQMPYHSARRL